MRAKNTVAVTFLFFGALVLFTAGFQLPQQHAPLVFVRQFSSAEDVKGESHPILNKTLDIIAGPREDLPPPTSVLQQPNAVTTDLNHRIFVTDAGTGTVHVFDFAQGEHSVLRGGDRLRSPMGIAADREGNVYVSDGSLHTVLVYDRKGKFLHYLKKARGEESYFETPRGIAIDPATDHIYVCDTPRHMVVLLTTSGRVLATFGVRGGGSAPGQFRNPTQIVATASGITVLDRGNSRLQVLDARGNFRKEIKLASAVDAAGLAMDNQKNLYVSDPELNRLQVFSQDGRSLYQFGVAGSGPGQFNGITGLWVDSGHCLYAVDSKNKRVGLFSIPQVATRPCL